MTKGKSRYSFSFNNCLLIYFLCSVDNVKAAQSCNEKAEEFVSTNRLCDPLRRDDLSLSCSNRCGVEPTWQESNEGCSCDDKCIVYGDCCLDFHLQCNDLHQKALKKFRKFTGQVAICRHGVKVISSCVFPASSLSSMTTELSTSTEFSTFKSELITFQSTTLPLPVMDLSNSLVMLNDVYDCFMSKDSEPFYLPLNLVPSDGNNIFVEDLFQSPNLEDINLKNVLKSTRGVRGCFKEEAVICKQCEEYPLPKLCQSFSPQIGNSNVLLQNEGKDTPSEMIHDSCRLLPSGTPSFIDYRNQATVTKQFIANGKDFILLSTIATWRSIWCKNEECEIIECSFGYLLFNNISCFKPNFVEIQQISGLNQSVPEPATLCTCMKMFNVIKSLMIWELSKANFLWTKCRYQIKDYDGMIRYNSSVIDQDDIMRAVDILSKRTENLKDNFIGTVKNLTDDNSMNGEEDTRSSQPASMDELYTKLKDQLLSNQDVCNDEYASLIVRFGSSVNRSAEIIVHTMTFSMSQSSLNLGVPCTVLSLYVLALTFLLTEFCIRFLSD